MTIIDYGETYSSDTFEVRDSAGVLANAGTITATITFPDNTTTNPTVNNTATGKYAFDLTPTGGQIQAGLHRGVISATGGVLGTLVRKWTFTYEVDNEAALVSTRDALQHMRGTATITAAADIEFVRWLCLVATEAVERALNRSLVRKTITDEAHDGGDCHIRLRHTPVVSITTVTESGAALTGGADVDWVLYPEEGLLERGGTSAPAWWRWGRRNVKVTYEAGYIDPPKVPRKVALNTVQAMWQTSQQAPHPALDDLTADTAVFNSVSQLNPLERQAFKTYMAAAVF